MTSSHWAICSIFCGASPARGRPPRVQVIGPPVMDRTAVEEVLSCEVSRGKASAIIFRSELLELPNVCPAIADYASASHNWGKPRLPATRDSFASKTIRVW
jgi:hypothetical protein